MVKVVTGVTLVNVIMFVVVPEKAQVEVVCVVKKSGAPVALNVVGVLSESI